MPRNKPEFDQSPRVAGLSIEGLESEQSIVYLLDADRRLIYCNPAWDRFASQNDGDGLKWDGPRGTAVLEATAEPLRPFYEEGFRKVDETREVWEHDFDCSSGDLYRRYHMEVKPLEATEGFFITNSLLVELPHRVDRLATPGAYTLYLRQGDIVKMCCHCRRTERSDGSQIWDWVPRYLESPPGLVSHGLCASCSTYFYP